jgi:hypothetical protein
MSASHDQAVSHQSSPVTQPDHMKGIAAMHRRPVVRKAIKSAIIANAARHLGHRAEKHAEKHLEKKVEERFGKA